MNLFDHVFLATLVLASSLVDRFWLYPRLVRATGAGVPGARSRFYAFGIFLQWALVGSLLAAWIRAGRGWSELALGTSTPGRQLIGFGLAALYLGLAWSQRRALIARPQRLERLRDRFGSASALVPRTTVERRGFALLSLTAGVCEEILFRGFVTWYASQYMHPVLAVAASAIGFGFGHVYLGFPHVVRTTLVGALFSGIVALSGTLWPAMIIHAAMDLLAGDLGHRAFGGEPGAQAIASS